MAVAEARTEDMTRDYSWPKLLRFVAPSIATALFTSVYVIVDGLFISNFAGATPFAAVNFVYPYVLVLGSLGFMVGTGGSAIVAKARGEGHPNRANRYFSMIIFATLAAGIALSVFGALSVRPVCAFMGAEGEMLDCCTTYGRIICISLSGFILQCAFQVFFVTAGRPNIAFRLSLVSGIANIVLDALLVGVLGMGIVGAGIATNIGEFIGGLFPLYYFARKGNTSLLKLAPTRFEWRILGRTCVNGSSEMMANVSMSLVDMLYNFQLLRLLGSNGVAAYGVIGVVFLIYTNVYVGFSNGSAPLMSYQYGAQNRAEMQVLLKKGLIFISIAAVAMLLFAEATAYPVALAFVSYDQELIALTVQAQRLFSVAYMLLGFNVYASSLFTALDNGVVSAAISFVRTLLIEAGCVIALPLLFGVQAIWLAYPTAEGIAMIISFACIGAFNKRYGYLPKRK